MKRREFLGFSSALAITSFASPLFAKENFTIYGAPALPSLMIGVATLQGNLAKKYDMNLSIWKNPDQLRAGVASGEFKVMMSPSNVGVNLRNQKQNVGMINILTTGLNHVLSKVKFNSIGDLEGKKLIMPFKNDMPDIVIRALFKKIGIDISKIDITYTPTPPEAMGLFLAKDYDAAFLPEPMSSACILKGKKMGVNVERNFDITGEWSKAFGVKPIIPQAGIIANSDFFAAHKDDFDTLHEDLKNALAWIKSNTQSAAEIGTNYFPAPAPAIATAIPNANLCVYKGSEIKDEIMKFFEVVMEFNPKLLGGSLPKEEFFLC